MIPCRDMTRLMCHRDPFGRPEYEFRILRMSGRREMAVEKVEFTEATAGVPIPAFLKLDAHEVQILMDSLWEAGARPSTAVADIAHEQATEKHLNDMRAIAFYGLKMEVPK